MSLDDEYEHIPELKAREETWGYKLWASAPEPFELLPRGFGDSKSASVDLPPNEAGRDFAIGDIHGMWDATRSLLATVEFDPTRDRLLSIGDLIDRGPKSHEFEAWMDWPPFHAIRGNHEQSWCDGAVGGPYGNRWTVGKRSMEKRLLQRMLTMPITMTVPTEKGSVGFVHANVSPDRDWDEFRRSLHAGDHCDGAQALFVYRNYLSPTPVVGIDRVIVGHKPQERLETSMNVLHLDTGACYGEQLSLAQIHPGPWQAWGIRTGPLSTLSSSGETPIPEGRTARVAIPEWGQTTFDHYPEDFPERGEAIRAEAAATLLELLPDPDPEAVAQQGPDAELIEQLRAEAEEWGD